jgi:hypothetical protein
LSQPFSWRCPAESAAFPVFEAAVLFAVVTYSAFIFGGAALVVDGLLLLLVGQYFNVPLDMRKILAFLEELYPLLEEKYL